MAQSHVERARSGSARRPGGARRHPPAIRSRARPRPSLGIGKRRRLQSHSRSSGFLAIVAAGSGSSILAGRRSVGQAGIAEPGADGQDTPALHIAHEWCLTQYPVPPRRCATGRRSRRSPILRDRLVALSGKLKRLLSSCPAGSARRGRWCRPTSMMPGQPMPMNGARSKSFLAGACDQTLSISISSSTASSRLSFFSSPVPP